MIQFHLSKAFAKEMAMHIQESTEINPGAMQWYAHQVVIDRRKCVVVMELQSRYAMVFCGLTKNSFEAFPDLFIESLLTHVLNLMVSEEEADDEDLIQALGEVILFTTGEQSYQIGHDRSVQSHISQVVEHLEIMVYEQGYVLPVENDDAFVFAMATNDMLRKRKGDKDYFIPKEVFMDFWFGLFERFVSHRSDVSSEELPANVIAVDFSKNKS